MRTKPKIIALPKIVAQELESRLERIKQMEHDLSMLRDGMHWFLYQQTGVDVAQENWTLDVDHWELRRN